MPSNGANNPAARVNIHRRALRNGLLWSVIWAPLMYAKMFGAPWRNFHPFEMAALLVSGFLGGWLVWGYGFYWLFAHVGNALLRPRDRG